MSGQWVYIDKYRTKYTLLNSPVPNFNDFVPHWIGQVEKTVTTPEGIIFYIRSNMNGREVRTHVFVSEEV